MAFWGTEREDAWRRRKAREQEREAIIRKEGKHQLQDLAARHATEIQEKESVLDIARGLLSDARHDCKVARRNSEGKAENDKEEDTNRNKRAIDLSEEADESHKRRRRVKHERDDEEKQAEESVREHLLALSYSMFDTLYGTKSFKPRPFCEFLVKSGERVLAEQIALAAIEKSNEKGSHVSFVLEVLVPQSDEPDELVGRIRELLIDTNGDESGREALLQWTLQNGTVQEQFSTALMISDESLRLQRALPFATTAERRQQLKESCTILLDARVIGMFEEDEWPKFMASCPIPVPAQPLYLPWRPSDHTYLQFAATEMTVPNNIKVAEMILGRAIQAKLDFAVEAIGRLVHPTRLAKCGADELKTYETGSVV